jgi:DNA-binding response OmpR family regulator
MQVLSPKEKKLSDLSSRILIVEDDDFLRTTLRQQLAVEGFDNVTDVGIITNLDNLLSKISPDLIILNLQMPDGSSVDICRRLRGRGFSKPIIMLSAKSANDDIALGLEAGANDYITKPLRMVELIACIRKQLDRLRISSDIKFEIGGLSFVPGSKMLVKVDSDQEQILTEKETSILKFLYQAFPSDISKAQILSEIWGFQSTVSTHTLETHIYRLRQKISQLTDKQLVLTTGNGYRLAD